MKHLFSKYRVCGTIALISAFGLTTPHFGTVSPVSIEFGTVAHAQTTSSMSQIESIDFTVGRLVQTDRLNGQWVEYDFRGQERYRFNTVRQDSRSVLLRGQNGGVDLLVDLSNKAISGEWVNHPMQKLYTIAQVKLFETQATSVTPPRDNSPKVALRAPKNEKILDRIIPKIMSVKNDIRPEKKEDVKKAPTRATVPVKTATLKARETNPPITATAAKATDTKPANQDAEKPLIDSEVTKPTETSDVTWPIDTNSATGEAVKPEFIPSSKPSNVNTARYTDGVFQTENGALWVETTPDGESFKYKKIGENSDSIFLYNDTRNVFIEIDVKAKHSLISQNGESLRSYFVLTDVGAITQQAPIISTANAPIKVGSAPTKKARFELPFLAKRTGKLSIIERSKCLARGGKVERGGILDSERCTMPYSDAGKVCIDSSNCSGKCVVDSSNQNNGAFSGTCQIDDNPFGCYAEVVAGEAQPALCVD